MSKALWGIAAVASLIALFPYLAPIGQSVAQIINDYHQTECQP